MNEMSLEELKREERQFDILEDDDEACGIDPELFDWYGYC